MDHPISGAHDFYGIGNGQLHQSFMDSIVGALNCMHDQQAVMEIRPNPVSGGGITN